MTNFFLINKNFYGENNNDFDSILILGGDEKRILHGLNLAKINPDAKIFFSGGVNLVFANQDILSDDEQKIFNKISKKFIDKSKLVTIPNSRNTIENIKNFKKINKFNFSKTVVVTDPWHYKRTLLIAKILNVNLKHYKWPQKQRPSNFFQHYQKIDVGLNLMVFNRFFREIYGILAIIIFKL